MNPQEITPAVSDDMIKNMPKEELEGLANSFAPREPDLSNPFVRPKTNPDRPMSMKPKGLKVNEPSTNDQMKKINHKINNAIPLSTKEV